MAVPTTTDVQDFLTAAGVSYGSSDVAGALASVISQFGKDAGWVPYQKDTVDASYFYDIPECETLNLGRGLLALTNVYTACNYDGTGGVLATEGVNFLLEPYDGGIDGRPYRRILFLTEPGGYCKRSIKVTGKWGYTDGDLDDVNRLIIRKTAFDLVGDLNVNAEVMESIKQGPVEFQYLTDRSGSTIERDWQRCVYRHLREML